MSKLGINTGTVPNDDTGDSLLEGAVKVNSNFDELYTLLGDGNTLSVGVVTAITAGSGIDVSSASGNVTITNSGSTINTLNDIGDVTISGTPTTGYVLKWGGSTWEPAADNNSGGGGASNLSALSDVGITNLENNHILKYDSGTGEWKNTVEDGNITIGVRIGTAVNIGFAGTTFDVVGRTGNISISV